MRTWKPRTRNTNDPKPTAANTMQVNNQKEDNLEDL